MIRYALACEAGHEFDSWFPSGESYDMQVARGLVECPACGSAAVGKRLMAPSLRIGSPAPEAAAAQPAGSESGPAGTEPAPQPLAVLSERELALRAMLRAVREQVTQNADYVGKGFADEARKMHYGETEKRSIYGEAHALDAKALLEEGIEIHALPPAPDDRN